jgi:hypothetical protein
MSTRFALCFGQEASHLIVDFLGGAKFHVVRERAKPRLDYLLPARRTVPRPQEYRQDERGKAYLKCFLSSLAT